MPNTEADEGLYERFLHADDELELRRELQAEADFEDAREHGRAMRMQGGVR